MKTVCFNIQLCIFYVYLYSGDRIRSVGLLSVASRVPNSSHRLRDFRFLPSRSQTTPRTLGFANPSLVYTHTLHQPKWAFLCWLSPLWPPRPLRQQPPPPPRRPVCLQRPTSLCYGFLDKRRHRHIQLHQPQPKLCGWLHCQLRLPRWHPVFVPGTSHILPMRGQYHI